MKTERILKTGICFSLVEKQVSDPSACLSLLSVVSVFVGCALKSRSVWSSQDKQLRDVGDWRKNIEDKSDRKKMFDS